LDLLGSFCVLFSFPSLFWIWTPIWYQGLWLGWPPSAILTCSGGGGARWWRISWSLLWFFGFKVSACLSVHFQPDLCLVCLWIVVVFRVSLWDLWSGVFSDHSMFLGCFVTLFPAVFAESQVLRNVYVSFIFEPWARFCGRWNLNPPPSQPQQRNSSPYN
jgi:hypothetical protein